ncbi:MAG: hypothetical protein R3C39_02685 [Dehalococcoidia bacterium]
MFRRRRSRRGWRRLLQAGRARLGGLRTGLGRAIQRQRMRRAARRGRFGRRI